MNISHLFQWGVGAVAVAACGSLMAQGDANAPETGAQAAAISAPAQPPSAVDTHAVAGELNKLQFFNAQPNPDAKYYIYLYSASWCPPCRAEMPKIVADYAEMKEKGVEVILLGCDRTRDKAEAYLKTFKAPFAGIMAQEGVNLPGFTEPRYIPHAVIVKNTGEVLVSGSASGLRGVMSRWRDIIAKDAQSHHAVADELAKLTYFNNVQPNPDAKFYIYLCSASGCPPCRAEMPQIVEDYAAMKELGVEVVMLSCDYKKEKAVQFLKDFKAPFPGAFGQNYKDLPGLIAGIKVHGPMIPYAVIVTNTGKLVAANISAGPDGVMTHWKDYVTGKMTDPQAEQANQPAPAAVVQVSPATSANDPQAEQASQPAPAAVVQVSPATSANDPHAVAGELGKLQFFNAQPNPNAEYYIYLYSASWCPPCRAEMPKIVADYAEMKEKGVEVILLGCDRTRDKAEAYLKTFKAPFAGIMVQEGVNLPGFARPQGIPYAVIVKNTGEVLVSDFAGGSRGVMSHWRDVIAKSHADSNGAPEPQR